MADDNTLRSYRSKDSYRRSANQPDAPEPAFGGTDPLAELARLIGQTDPFAETAGRQPPPAAPRVAPEEPGDWRRHIQRPKYAEMREEPAFDSDPRYADPRYADPGAGYADPNAGYADPNAGYADPDPRYAEPDQRYADPGTGYADHDPYRIAPTEQDRYADPHGDYRRDQSYTADYPDEPIHAAAPQRGGYAGGQPPYGDEGYDDPPRRNRSNGLVTAVVLIGCAMLGTAGAYAYRTYATSSGSTQAPVIIADNSPNKIVPATDKKSARSQDRVGGQQGNDERLVSREEQPVTLQPPGTAAVPRVVFPSPVQPAPPTTTGTTPPPSAANAQSSATDQPKRVRTVTIRPEGGDSSGRPSGDVPTRAAPPPPARTAAPPPSRASRDQPLSLDPSAPAQVNEPARPQPQQRALTPPAPRETPAPGPRVASAPASGSGGYLVQVSSQRSESDAQASYRALQGKYSQLKSHPPVIRRADLGSKGVYYRAMVGPFESGEEAVQFCNGLKQAGGQCIIHRN